jgi:tRNA dimethylallyltransferase
LVGGTGQYIRAILEGWDIPKAAPDNIIRRELQNWMNRIGPGGLYARLAVIDPVAASKIDPHNFRRTIRALEVILRTGRRFSEQRTHREPAYRWLLIGLTRPRKAIYERVDQRVEQMFQHGLVEEVRNLLEQGYPENLPAFSAIGYREVIEYLNGKISLEEAIMRMKKRTRVFIRHQANWFKPDDPSISWHTIENDIIDDLEAEIRKWLNNS